MKLVRSLALIAALSLPVFAAVEVGQTLDQVLAEKGNPSNKLEMGDVVVLNYPDQRIKLKAGKVVEVKAVEVVDARPTPTPAPASKPVAATKPTAKKPGAPSVTWTTNYQGALAQAKDQNAKVFLFFTGSDWCGWCMRFDKEILSTPEFAAYAGQNLVLVKLDFPQGIPITEEVKRQNEALAQRHKIRGFPTVVVLNSQGKPVGQLGYQKGGPGPFIEALEKL